MDKTLNGNTYEDNVHFSNLLLFLTTYLKLRFKIGKFWKFLKNIFAIFFKKSFNFWHDISKILQHFEISHQRKWLVSSVWKLY
jgi:hypothetical protein